MKRMLQVALVLAVVGVLQPATAMAQPTGLASETARSIVFKWDKVMGATWYYLWVHDASGLTFQQWYTEAEANCNPGYLEDCRVGVPLSVVPSGNVTWWVRSWGPTDGYGPWSAGQVVGPPGPYFAVIASDGTTSRGNNVSSQSLGTGSYEVIFGRNVTGCAFIGNTGGTGIDSPNGMVSTARRLTSANGVFVETTDHAGAVTDMAFHLTVICP